MSLHHTPLRPSCPTLQNELISVDESTEGDNEGPSNVSQQLHDIQYPREQVPNLGYVSDDLISAIRKPQPPPFIKDRPDIWFFLIESEFNTTRTRSDEAKYNATLRALDTDTLQQVTDILYNPPEQNKYEHLKRAIIQRLSDSRQKQIQRLLNDLVLADKKPSQLLREMKDLAAGSVQDEMLHSLWINRLPVTIRPLLVTSNTLDLNALAEMADRIMDATYSQPNVMATTYSQPNIMAVSRVDATPSTSSSSIQRLEQRVDELQKALALCLREITALSTQSSFQRPRYRSRSRPRSKTPENAGICYYHKRFGTDAQKCTTPCTFKQQSQGN